MSLWLGVPVGAVAQPATGQAQATQAASGAPAPAGPRESRACRRECNAGTTPREALPREAQACLVRCAATARYLQRQARTGTAEATGRGAAAGTAAGAAGASSAAAGGRTLVAYAGLPPSVGFAIASGTERTMAHQSAERACASRNQNRPCRLLSETRDRCIAVAQGVRAVGVAVTADPRTYTVHLYTSGAGQDQRAAEFAALSDCATRTSEALSCRVVSQSCG